MHLFTKYIKNIHFQVCGDIFVPNTNQVGATIYSLGGGGPLFNKSYKLKHKILSVHRRRPSSSYNFHRLLPPSAAAVHRRHTISTAFYRRLPPPFAAAVYRRRPSSSYNFHRLLPPSSAAVRHCRRSGTSVFT